MLPVVSGTAATARAVLVYSVVLLGTTLVPALLAPSACST